MKLSITHHNSSSLKDGQYRQYWPLFVPAPTGIILTKEQAPKCSCFLLGS